MHEQYVKIIKGLNKKITLKPRDQRPKRKCRKKSECSKEGNCQVNNGVYKCDVTRPFPKKLYLGLAEEEWKSRFYNHKLSFTHKRYSNKTRDIPTRQRYMWHLKNVSSKTPNLKWSVLRWVPTYSNISKKCLLCFYEKQEIVTYQNQKELLNKKSELLCKCCHANKFLLKNYTGNDFRSLAILSSIKNLIVCVPIYYFM